MTTISAAPVSVETFTMGGTNHNMRGTFLIPAGYRSVLSLGGSTLSTTAHWANRSTPEGEAVFLWAIALNHAGEAESACFVPKHWHAANVLLQAWQRAVVAVDATPWNPEVETAERTEAKAGLEKARASLQAWCEREFA